MEPLAKLLRRRVAVIADHDFRDRDPDGHLEQLKTISEELDRLHAKMKPDLPPRLDHFLEQKSYAKALQFIEDAQATH